MAAAVLLDSDTLSEVIKGRDPRVLRHAVDYLQEHHVFRFSIVTRFEILRGLQAKEATRQIAAFLDRCRVSTVYP
jgi:tRNA(fMet)-specific endonuclease VapC